MIYALIFYTIGLGLMTWGFILSPECEKAEADTFGTLVAYLFWPVSFVVVAAVAVWQNTSLYLPKLQPDRWMRY